jgi:hypothetical protein
MEGCGGINFRAEKKKVSGWLKVRAVSVFFDKNLVGAHGSLDTRNKKNSPSLTRDQSPVF